MELEGPEAQQPEQQPQQPPEIDPRTALEIAARQFNTTPEQLESTVRLQEENQRVYEENRRRTRELELREAKIEALGSERARYAPQEPQFEVDPVVRPIFDKVNSLEQSIAKIIEREDMKETARQQGEVLHGYYQSFMRAVPSQSQLNPEQFFGGMAELYPHGIPEGMTPATAVERTARYLGVQGGIFSQGTYPPIRNNAYNNHRDPRAAVVIPGAPSIPTAAPTGVDMSPQRSGETIEAYSQRIEQSGRALQDLLKQSGLNSLPERYASG